MGSKLLLERINIAEGVPAVDLQDGANTGDYVSLQHYDRVAVVLMTGLGTATEDPTLTIQQATSVAGGSVKSLTFTDVYTKQAATSLAAVTKWTKTTQTAANTYTNGTLAEEDAIVVVEFRASDLDADGGFDCLRATVADVGGSAQPGVIFYILGDPSEASSVVQMPDPLV